MVVAQHAKELVGLAHTNMLAALGNADPNDTERCYGLINNLFQVLRLEDFYTELCEVQEGKPTVLETGTEVDSMATSPDNVTTFPEQKQEPTVEEKLSTRSKEEVRDLLVRVSKANMDLKSILSKYNASKFSDLVEVDYDAVYADAEALLSEV